MKYSLEGVTAVILAGGLGTRIQALYPNLPKPMIPVCGRPFVEWVVRYLAKQGIHRTIISSGYLAEVVSRHFESHPVKEVQVQCVSEMTPQGTAGGFLEAIARAQTASDCWLVLNGDSLIFADLGTALGALSDDSVEGLVIGVTVPDTSRYGRIICSQSGRLIRFEEKQPGKGAINAGVYVFKEQLVNRFPATRPLSFEKDVFPKLLVDSHVIQTNVTQTPFLDIGTPDSIVLAEDFIEQNKNQFA
jgi:D-glycero-alpha-D-manno-heptose 1-phosphate guanylyltransferase